MPFVNPNQPQNPTGQGPNIPAGGAGPITPAPEDDLDALLQQLNLSPEEAERLAEKQRRLNAQAARGVGEHPLGQLPNGHVFFDPGTAILNAVEKYRYRKGEKELDAETKAQRERTAAARAKVAERLPGLSPEAQERIAGSVSDEQTLRALQLIRQRKAEEAGNAREDSQRREERAQREADVQSERTWREKQEQERRAFLRSESAKDRDARRATIAAQLEAKTAAGKTGNPSEGERKAAALATRLESALLTINQATQSDPDAARPGLLEKGLESVGLDAAANSMRSSGRQQANAAQLDALDAALTLATGAAYTREQLRGQAVSYFPQVGDTPETIKNKAERFQTLINTARLQSGRSEGQINQALPNAPAQTAPNAAPQSAGGAKTVDWSSL